jgi:EpsI family protein
MTSPRSTALALCVVFAAAIPVSLRWGDPVDRLLGTVRPAQALALAIPTAAEGWTGSDQALSAKERRTLQLDDYVERTYRGPDGEALTLFVSFYGNKQRGLQRYYHNPTICYRDAGWTLLETHFERVTLQDLGREVPTCRYLFERDGQRLSVTTFFQIDDELLDESPRNKPFWTLLEKMTPSLSDAPGSFAQVQIIAPVAPGDDGAAAAATSRFLHAFGAKILAAIRPGVGS